MTLSTAQSTVLGSMLTGYANQPEEKSSPTAITRQLRPVREQVSATAKTSPAIPAVKKEHTALISARDFVVGMRRAKDRQEKVALISQYAGYDPAEDFGTQEMVALRKANQSINPPRNAGSYSVRPGAAGYVAGKPNPHEKEIQDLESRERLAVDKMLELEKQALECTDSVVAAVYHAQAEVETQRVFEIRQDLKRLRAY
jgi:hypothetical protein